jgi:hypothetical protein
VQTNVEWISTVEVPPRADGIRGGGPWRLQVLRAASNRSPEHLWDIAFDPDASSEGCRIFRDREGHVCRVDVSSREPFQTAADMYGLDTDVFGSPALWPMAHVTSQPRLHAHGWVLALSDVQSSFPFTVTHTGEAGNGTSNDVLL